ncbi:MAG: hypothetical protein AAGA60_21745, partial [Cyanobacteria bacterium P01_E01_bin.42]
MKNIKEYYKEEEKYWHQLRQKLKDYKRNLKATDEDIKNGLGISRQPLSEFLNEKKKTLSIRRLNLIQLWDYLTNPENFESKNLSEEFKEARNLLRKKGYGELLKTAGYLPDPDDTYIYKNSSPSDHQKIDWGEDLDKA